MTNQSEAIEILRQKVSANLAASCKAQDLDPASITAYVLEGTYPGPFLYEALANDFLQAYANGISINGPRKPEHDLNAWGYVIGNYVPADAKGSHRAVDRWMAHRGMVGLS